MGAAWETLGDFEWLALYPLGNGIFLALLTNEVLVKAGPC